MNIAIFVKNLTSGGAEKQSVLQARSLSSDHNVFYIIFNADKVHQKYLDLLNEDNKIHVTGFRGNHINRFFQLVKFLRNNKIEVIFSFLTAANLYACLAAKFTDIKVFTGLRNSSLPFGKLLTDKFLCNHFAYKAISNSHSGKEIFSKQGFNIEKIDVIPNCFENISPYKDKSSKNYVQIITVGRFVEQKDYRTAINSIALLKKKCSNFKFVIVGYGQLESQIRGWIKEYNVEDEIEIKLNPNNISSLLEQSDIYISTSLFEGTSNSIMEGMNADLPIVATNVGDNNKLIINDYNGYLVEIGNTNKISEQLLILINDEDKRKEMGKNSKIHLSKNFSQEKFRNQYLKELLLHIPEQPRSIFRRQID